MRKRLSMVIAALLGLLALGACTSSGGSLGNDSGGGTRAQVDRLPAHAPSPSGERAAAPAGDRAPAKDAAPVLGAAKIRTAELTVAIRGAERVATKADAAGDIATRAGGEIDADDRTAGASATATLRLRIPPEQLRATLRVLARLGKERSREMSTADVTARVADVDSRVASARGSIARLRALYASAKRVSDVIAVEGELSSRQAELESLEAAQRTLSRQTSMATVTLYLQTADTQATSPKKRNGFLGGLERGWDGFVAAASWVATAAGTVLPFLVLVLVLGLAARLLGVRLPGRDRGPDRGERRPAPHAGNPVS